MKLNDREIWDVIRKLDMAEKALEILTHDLAFTRTVGLKSSIFTELMHSRTMILAHIELWKRMVGKNQKSEQEQEEAPF